MIMMLGDTERVHLATGWAVLLGAGWESPLVGVAVRPQTLPDRQVLRVGKPARGVRATGTPATARKCAACTHS
jgi:hypothetical protein